MLNNLPALHILKVWLSIRVVIGSAGLLREDLIKSTYDSYIGGHAGIQNTYRRLKGSFPLAFYEEISARNSSAL